MEKIEEALSGEKILQHKESIWKIDKKMNRKPWCEGIPTDILELSRMKRS